MTGPKSSVETLRKRRIEVRRLIRQEADQDEIIQVLSGAGYRASRATYFRDLKALRKEDKQWIRDQAREGFVSDYRRAIEVLREQVRQLQVIRKNAQRPYDKISATNSIAEIETQIIDLLAQGPVVLGLKMAGEKVYDLA